MSSPQVGRLRWRDRGQSTLWMVSTVFILVLAFGLVADGAVLFAAHRRALELADAAARAGAGQVDKTRLRLEPNSPVRLDPTAARAAAVEFVARRGPDATPEVVATAEWIDVRVRLSAATGILHPFGRAVVDVVAEAYAAPFAGVEAPGR